MEEVVALFNLRLAVRQAYAYPAVAAVVVLDDFIELFFSEITVFVVPEIFLKVFLELLLLRIQGPVPHGADDELHKPSDGEDYHQDDADYSHQPNERV